MQLKLHRKEVERGLLSKRIEYQVRAALLVSDEEQEQLKRHGLWNRPLRPLRGEDEGDYEAEVFSVNTLKHLVAGFTVNATTLGQAQDFELAITAACREFKNTIEGGQAGERTINI